MSSSSQSTSVEWTAKHGLQDEMLTTSIKGSLKVSPVRTNVQESLLTVRSCGAKMLNAALPEELYSGAMACSSTAMSKTRSKASASLGAASVDCDRPIHTR